MDNIKISHAEKAEKFSVAFLCPSDKMPKTPSKAFEGKLLQTLLVYGKSRNVLYVGIGKKSELNPLDYKEIGGTIAKAFKKEKIFDFSVDCEALDCDYSLYSNLAQGLALGTYSYTIKSDKEKLENWDIEIAGEDRALVAESAINEGLLLAEAVSFARDVTNAPANHLRPAQYAEKIVALLKPYGVECEIIAGKDLEKKGLNGLYLIGNSSDFEPQLVVMKYKNGGKKKTALVGKGITFDTGGYSLKPSASMLTMNGDMGGSASVVAAIYALAKSKAKANVVGVVALAENRISAGSLVPGDIYTAYDGQTVEVLNTDAEGRLVLADAVAYAVKDEKADRVIDIATLTGAMLVALGYGVTGTVSNDDTFYAELDNASTKTGERYHRMPVYPEYEKMLESKIADVKNIGEGVAGGIMGGLFVRNFVKEKPWIHLDIAGTSWVKKPLFAHQSEGATGTAVDTFYYLCKED